tara:strand:- start:209 stop:469 length:261 start_codon:yes stop_codon:yes gene_type:complete
MKGLLFFAGTALRWPAQQPKQFLILHLYIVTVYILTFLTRSAGLNIANFVFTLGFIAPVSFLISKGLPLDCLDYKSAIEKEIELKL